MPPNVQIEKTCDVERLGLKSSFVQRDMTSKPKPSRKSVSFQDTITFREICPRAEMAEEEFRQVWYSDEEYSKMKKVVSNTVKKAEKGEVVEESKGMTMRGLEGRTKFGARRRKNNKAAALDAVWKTQIELWKKKTDQPLAIATAYRPHSTHAKYRALQAAHSDEVYVKENVKSNG